MRANPILQSKRKSPKYSTQNHQHFDIFTQLKQVIFYSPHRRNPCLRILNNTSTSSVSVFETTLMHSWKIAAGFCHPEKTFSLRHVSNDNIQEAQKGALQFGKLLICPCRRWERKGSVMGRAPKRNMQDATSKIPIKQLPPSNRLMKPGSEIKSSRPDWIAASLHVHWIKF